MSRGQVKELVYHVNRANGPTFVMRPGESHNLTAADMGGVIGDAGTIVWMTGPLAEAFRAGYLHVCAGHPDRAVAQAIGSPLGSETTP